MEFRQLSYLVAVARAGSISGAAVGLRMTQPSLSAAISQLESELGAPLFTRSTRGVSLTPTGAYVVRQAQRILRDVDEMKATVRSMVSGTAGSLVLGVTPVLAWQSAPAIIRAFTVASPDVVISVRERNAGELLELVLEEAIDCAIIATASSEYLRDFHQESLVVEKLGVVELAAALPLRFRDAPDPISLVDIADEEIAIPPASARTYGLRAGLLRAFDRANVPVPRIRDVPSLFEAIPLAMAGVSVAIIPASMLESLRSPDIVMRRMSDGPDPLDVSLLYRRGRGTGQTVRKFVRVARELARTGLFAMPSRSEVSAG